MSHPVFPVAPRTRVHAPPLEGGTLPRRSNNTWATYRRVESSRHDGPVSRLEFSPADPHEAAVTAGSSVALLDARSSAVRRRLSRFKDIARGGSYKGDGRLLVAGGDNGVVQVFDLASRGILRTFTGHKGYVWCGPSFSWQAPAALAGGVRGGMMNVRISSL